MLVVKNERILPVDVDGTLILPYEEGKKRVEVYDSITKKFITMSPHEPNIRLLKEESHRGAHIIVWSRGGFQWASNVVKALDLVDYVDIVMSKPISYIDDVPVKKWMPDRVYLQPDMRYKK